MMLSELHLYEAQALKAGLVTQADLAAASPHTLGSKSKPVGTGGGGGGARRDPAAEAQVRFDSFANKSYKACGSIHMYLIASPGPGGLESYLPLRVQPWCRIRMILFQALRHYCYVFYTFFERRGVYPTATCGHIACFENTCSFIRSLFFVGVQFCSID